MNLQMAKTVLSYGGMAAAIIGLILLILQIMSKGEQIPRESEENKRQSSFLVINWVIFFIVAAIMATIIGLSPGHTGMRGTLASGLLGFFIPILLSSMECLTLKKNRNNQDRVPMFVFSSLPAGGIGLSLLFMGFVTTYYGIRAINLWIAFIIGAALGLYLLRLASNLVKFSRYRTVATKMETVMYLVIAAICGTIMAGYHFKTQEVRCFIPAILLMSIYIISLLCTATFSYKKSEGIMKVLPTQLAVFLTLFLGFVVFFINKLGIKVEYSYTLIAGAITSALFIILLHNSARWIKGVDLSVGSISVLLLIGGIWFSYKWGLGFGMTLYSLGLLSVGAIIVPHKSLETVIVSGDTPKGSVPLQPEERDVLLEGEEADAGENSNNAGKNEKKNTNNKKSIDIYDIKPDDNLTWAKLFTRAIGLAGLSTLLICLHRILVQSTPLFTEGIDLAVMDVVIAFILGIFTSLFFEGFNLSGPGIFYVDKREGLGGGIWRFFAAALITVTFIFTVGVLFKLDGLGAYVLGLSIPALLGMFTYFSQKIDGGLFRASNAPLWIAAVASAYFLEKFRDLPDRLTRANKTEIVVFLVALLILIFILCHFFNRRRTARQ